MKVLFVELFMMVISSSLAEQPAGIDCTGLTDSALALQADINAAPDQTTFDFPSTCQIKLGSQIIVNQRIGLRFIAQGDGRTGRGAFIHWIGSALSAFSIQTSEYIRFEGFTFQCNSGAALNKWLDFDGEPTPGYDGTNPEIVRNNFQPCAPFDPTKISAHVSISDTAKNNWENGYLDFNSFGCNSNIALRGRDGVISAGYAVLQSPTANFVPADIGQRVRVSYAPNGPYTGGLLDTTITALIDAQHVALANAPTSSQVNASIHTGQPQGYGVYIGNSMNAKHHRIYNSLIDHCDNGIRVVAGSADIRHVGGYANNVGVFIGCGVVESTLIDFFETESDLVGIQSCAATVLNISHLRMSVGTAMANGFLQLDGKVLIQAATLQLDTGRCSGLPTNSVIVGFGGGSRLTSIASNWHCRASVIGFDRPWTYKFAIPPTTINDGFDDNFDSPHNFGCFLASPISCVRVQGEWDGAQGGSLELNARNLYSHVFTGGPLLLNNLPTSDPHIVGQPWLNGSALWVSGG